MTTFRYRRRAAGLARTFVVAVATLAILLVCFSMYQYSQVAPPVPLTPRGARLPVPGELPPPPPSASTTQPSGVNIDGAVIGASRNVTISLYPREGRDSKLELTVSDWSPRAGSDHEFLLRDPEVRMRTAEGNDLRIKAQEGVLEARRKSGSGLEPRRGKLTGNVVIEFDRRTQEEKARLSEAERTVTRDHDLVRIQAQELQFDVEFGRLIIPGNIVLTARDASLNALDLEMNFNQQENRIESLRIERGGRIELHSQSEGLGLAMGNRTAKPQKQTIVEWMRQSLQARIDAQSAVDAQKADAARQAEKAAAEKADPSIPVFRSVQPPRPRSVAQYVGRFEGDVDARQQLGDVTQSRLQADWLEILRELSLDERKPAKGAHSDPASGAPRSDEPPPLAERIVLTWTGKLIVNRQQPQSGEATQATASSRLTAGGTPARLSHPEGDAICGRLVYLPETGDIRLMGEGGEPVVVRSLQQGTIMGQSLSLRQSDDALDISVDGAGRLWGDSGDPTSTPLLSSHTAELGPANIDFADGLRAVGRVLRKTTFDFTGSMTRREYRLLDRVTFGGRTTLRQDDTALHADQIRVEFSVVESWRGVHQSIDRVLGTGNVLMSQGADRLTCDTMEIAMGAGRDGKATVRSATATGAVSALQGDRALQATEKLIVDFEPAAPGNDIVQVADGAPASAFASSTTAAAASPLTFSSAAAPRRLRAFGEVSVIDPSQSLDLSCEQLDCTIAPGKDIESAILTGLPDRPASVHLDTFSVTGKDITLDVLNEWADVPGQGRMTIQSQKDLDGRRVDQPIPIAITWTDGMKYRGRENRAVFSGNVHASSQTTTTFDCDDNLLVEFEDAPQAPQKTRRSPIVWGIGAPLSAAAGALDEHLGPQLDKVGIRNHVSALLPGAQSAPSVLRGFTKEPRYIEATGNAVAQTAELHPATSILKSRARISGPKLSLHLRSELSKMLIEGPGDLLLEDFQAAKTAESATPEMRRADLFSDQSDAGPSKTLINWRHRMWYDFGIDQTHFEGDVQLKHLSGAELDKVFGVPQGGTPNTAKGRRTFLNSDALTVDFTDAPRSARPQADQRMGRISSDRLRRFRAHGRVDLREEVDQFSLNAEDVTYERPRKTLMIQGAPHRKAQLIRQRPGRLPDQMSAERIFYNLETGKIEISKPNVKTGQ